MPLSNFMVSSKRRFPCSTQTSGIPVRWIEMTSFSGSRKRNSGTRSEFASTAMTCCASGIWLALMLAQAQLSGNLIIPSLIFLCWFVALCTLEKDLLTQLNPTHVKSWIVEEAHNSKFFILANFVTLLQTCFPTRVFQGGPRRFKRKLKNLWGRLHKSRLHCFKEFEEAGISGR